MGKPMGRLYHKPSTASRRGLRGGGSGRPSLHLPAASHRSGTSDVASKSVRRHASAAVSEAGMRPRRDPQGRLSETAFRHAKKPALPHRQVSLYPHRLRWAPYPALPASPEGRALVAVFQIPRSNVGQRNVASPRTRQAKSLARRRKPRGIPSSNTVRSIPPDGHFRQGCERVASNSNFGETGSSGGVGIGIGVEAPLFCRYRYRFRRRWFHLHNLEL